MKTFKDYLREMDLSREPSAAGDIEDRTGTRPKFKVGDVIKAGGDRQRTLSQKEAENINTGKESGGSPFPKSWEKKTEVAGGKTSLPPTKSMPKPSTTKTSTAPKSTETSASSSGYANPEWLKKHSWVIDAIKKNKAKNN